MAKLQLMPGEAVVREGPAHLIRGRLSLVFGRLTLTNGRLILRKSGVGLFLALSGLIGALIGVLTGSAFGTLFAAIFGALFGLIGALVGNAIAVGKPIVEVRLDQLAAVTRSKFGLNNRVLVLETISRQEHRITVDGFEAWIEEICKAVNSTGCARMVEAGPNRWVVEAGDRSPEHASTPAEASRGTNAVLSPPSITRAVGAGAGLGAIVGAVLGGAAVIVILLTLRMASPEGASLRDLLGGDPTVMMAVIFAVPTVIGAVGCAIAFAVAAAARRL